MVRIGWKLTVCCSLLVVFCTVCGSTVALWGGTLSAADVKPPFVYPLFAGFLICKNSRL